jgi:hypothetical protein
LYQFIGAHDTISAVNTTRNTKPQSRTWQHRLDATATCGSWRDKQTRQSGLKDRKIETSVYE